MCGDCCLIVWCLQNEDEEGYRKLIDQKKDRRLAYLLKQTDEYVESLTEVRIFTFLDSEFIGDFLRLGCSVFLQMVRDHKTSVRKKMQQEQKERRMQEEAQKYAIVESEENSQDSMNEENSQSSEQEQTIHVVEVSTRKILKGDDAPKASELDSWLEQHPVFFGKYLFSNKITLSISSAHFLDWLIDWFSDGVIYLTFDWLIDWLIGLVFRSVDRLIDWLFRLLLVISIDWLIDWKKLSFSGVWSGSARRGQWRGWLWGGWWGQDQ